MWGDKLKKTEKRQMEANKDIYKFTAIFSIGQ